MHSSNAENDGCLEWWNMALFPSLPFLFFLHFASWCPQILFQGRFIWGWCLKRFKHLNRNRSFDRWSLIRSYKSIFDYSLESSPYYFASIYALSQQYCNINQFSSLPLFILFYCSLGVNTATNAESSSMIKSQLSLKKRCEILQRINLMLWLTIINRIFLLEPSKPF